MAEYSKEQLFRELFLNEEASKETAGIVKEIAELWEERDDILAKILLKKISEKKQGYTYEDTSVFFKLDSDKNVGLQFCYVEKMYSFDFYQLDDRPPFPKVLGNKLRKILNEAQIHPIGTKATVDYTVWKEWETGRGNFEDMAKNIDKCASEVARVLGEIEKAYYAK